MNGSVPATAAEEWRAHWTLVLAGCLGFSMSTLSMMSLGAFMAPLEQAFGWKRAEIAFGLTIYAFLGVFLSPVVGNLVDRFGPRNVGLPGVLACGLGIALLGTVSSSIVHWIGLWVLLAFLAQGTKTVVWSAAVLGQFKASRGLALALTLSGAGIGSSIAPIYGDFLIGQLGWRLAYVALGASCGTVVGLVCYLFLIGRPAPVPVTTLASSGTTVEQWHDGGVKFRDALLTPTFAKLAAVAFFGNLLIVAAMVHLVPLLYASGLPRTEAVRVAGVYGGAAVLGKVFCGMLVDRIRGNYIGAFFAALPIIACAMLLSPGGSAWLRVIPVALLGLSGGALTHILAYLTTRYFGMRAFGTIFGLLGSLIAITTGIGPLVAGYIFDQTKSYDLMLLAGIPISCVCGLLLLTLRRYPDEPRPTASGDAPDETMPAVAT